VWISSDAMVLVLVTGLLNGSRTSGGFLAALAMFPTLENGRKNAADVISRDCVYRAGGHAGGPLPVDGVPFCRGIANKVPKKQVKKIRYHAILPFWMND
jgi:hypothetical protein